MSMNERKRTLEARGAPCVFEDEDPKTHKISKYYPAVNCDMKCSGCGWNPEEKKRRFAEGEMKEVRMRKSAEDESWVELPEGTKRLVFPAIVG